MMLGRMLIAAVAGALPVAFVRSCAAKMQS